MSDIHNYQLATGYVVHLIALRGLDSIEDIPSPPSHTGSWRRAAPAAPAGYDAAPLVLTAPRVAPERQESSLSLRASNRVWGFCVVVLVGGHGLEPPTMPGVAGSTSGGAGGGCEWARHHEGCLCGSFTQRP